MTFPAILQYKKTKTLTFNECIQEFQPLKKLDKQEWQQCINDLSNRTICTKNSIGSCTCIGDSGGALCYNNTLIGILSWSVRCNEGYPSVFTRIYPYVKWISKIIFE